MTGQSSWDPPPGWADPQSAAEPVGQSNGQYGHNWHDGSGGGAVLGSAGTTQHGHSQPQQGHAQPLNYSTGAHLAEQDADEMNERRMRVQGSPAAKPGLIMGC
eukprot:CAMPEP_0182564884 /NCGR_PEP_ID=MMETSP1324-20130603/6736_1 /TAXON_ID=236786 /ORGANISM="Florenciella sp., Strain RCC1587" /LENGTH=102 /DNA_ID=CAMNT_0024778435 /DNA_START=31 /DNA_END=337 /DNA_ORIENTATION=-